MISTHWGSTSSQKHWTNWLASNLTMKQPELRDANKQRKFNILNVNSITFQSRLFFFFPELIRQLTSTEANNGGWANRLLAPTACLSNATRKANLHSDNGWDHPGQQLPWWRLAVNQVFHAPSKLWIMSLRTTCQQYCYASVVQVIQCLEASVSTRMYEQIHSHHLLLFFP